MGIIYTDPGEMNRQVDIWDQPLVGAPVLVAAGIYAKIVGVASNTLSPISTHLGQENAWPRLDGARVAMATHNITIRYRAGLKSRMFLIYHDPDNGDRRFDIDRIVDPDEQKVELLILAIERNDGTDAFDGLLNATADVLIRDTSSGDKRGMSSPAFTTLTSGIACRVAEGTAIPRGKELLTRSKLAIAYRQVFMRPWFQDQSPDGSYIPYAVVSGVTYNTKPLTHDHWLLIPSASTLNSRSQATPGEMLDIFDIDNPGLAHHHLEVWARIVQV